ncbi:MAG: YifB family Mg chelatase-like AAA ATPase [Clostridia bacterium]|nr:YifB family Mg chelatase-like AAA ATPase [Clostridia bacterium]MBQ5769770.1 YifB family Mg chelatase-like AAA ATPase [Clostridia bacterium]
MLSTTLCYGLSGIDGIQITVEVNVSNGLPVFEIVGLPDTAVRESRERIRAAIKNCGYPFPDDRITVNLAPADIKKEGPAFDLPIAVAILACEKRVNPTSISGRAILGELALDGSVRPVRGVLPMAISAHDHGITDMILPKDNIKEIKCVSGVNFYPVETLTDVVKLLSGEKPIAPVETVDFSQMIQKREHTFDFRYVKGQRSAKRALEIAAAGGHNVLMVGPPGSGKTLMARCVPSILPDMSFEESLVATRIHSVAGTMPESGLLTERPFRSPHHTASHVSLVGGGIHATPGEISKAHHGVLFLDELPEYRRDVLEALRQPMEDGFVTITRVSAQSTYPSEFMLICSMNPCPCGHYGSKTHECRCTPNDIRKYLSRISGPLLDRIDMHIEVESIPAERLSDEQEAEPSKDIHDRVEAARSIQRKRYQAVPSLTCNARLSAQTLQRFCPMDKEAKEMLNLATKSMGLSNRAYTRVIKVARTIADLAGETKLTASHVAEALQYRAIDDKYWH